MSWKAYHNPLDSLSAALLPPCELWPSASWPRPAVQTCLKLLARPGEEENLNVLFLTTESVLPGKDLASSLVVLKNAFSMLPSTCVPKFYGDATS